MEGADRPVFHPGHRYSPDDELRWPAPMTPLPVLFRWAARALCLGALFAIGAEIASRVEDLARLGIPLSNAPDLRNDLIITDSLGTRGRPNGRYQRWVLNSAGFRSPESVLTPMTGCTRVMTLGASETFGAASESPGKEFPTQLADSLGGQGCYQVLNAAVVGITTPQITQLWNLWASRFQPDIVIVLANPQFYLTDKPPHYPKLGGSAAIPPNRWWIPRVISRAQEALQYPAFIQRIRVKRQLAALRAGHPPDWYFNGIPADRLSQYRSDVDSLVSSILSHGAVPIVTAYPMRFGATLLPEDSDMMNDWLEYCPRATPEVLHGFVLAAADEVRHLARERGVALVDLAGEMNGRREWFGDHVHYTDSGAGVLAGQLAHRVVEIRRDPRPPAPVPAFGGASEIPPAAPR